MRCEQPAPHILANWLSIDETASFGARRRASQVPVLNVGVDAATALVGAAMPSAGAATPSADVAKPTSIG
jgi:hypothetical protein